MSDKYYTKHTNELEDKYAAVQQAHLTSHVIFCVAFCTEAYSFV